MARRDFRERTQPLVMIIPMIDIMLFLLVFFMLSTLYMVQVNTLQVNLPTAASAAPETRPTVLPITVTSMGNIFFDDVKVEESELATKVSATLEANENTVFVLRGDRAVSYERVVAVLDLLKSSGAKRIALATNIRQ